MQLATCNLQLATWTKLVRSTVGIHPAIPIKKMTSEEDRIVIISLSLGTSFFDSLIIILLFPQPHSCVRALCV